MSSRILRHPEKHVGKLLRVRDDSLFRTRPYDYMVIEQVTDEEWGTPHSDDHGATVVVCDFHLNGSTGEVKFMCKHQLFLERYSLVSDS